MERNSLKPEVSGLKSAECGRPRLQQLTPDREAIRSFQPVWYAEVAVPGDGHTPLDLAPESNRIFPTLDFRPESLDFPQ